MFLFSNIQPLLLVVITLLLSSCVPKPSSDQVKFDPASIGRLSIVETTQLGVLPVGEVHSIFLTLQNSGKLSAKFKSLILNEPDKIQYIGNEYPGVGGTCEKELAPGQTCTLAFQAYSSSITGFSESFNLEYTNGIGTVHFSDNFRGYFGVPANVELNLNVDGKVSHDFGLIEPGATKSYLIELVNKGDLPATGLTAFFDSPDSVFHFYGGFYPGVNGTCGKTLNTGKKCFIEIAATPQSPGVETKGSFKVNYSNPISSRTFTMSLVVFAAEIKAYLTVFDKYQNIPDTVNHSPADNQPLVTWKVGNVGLAPASGIQIVAGDLPLDFVSSDCPELLNANEVCHLTYKWNPQFAVPLPSGQIFPIRFNERMLQFSYLDSKNPLPVLTEEVSLNAKVLDEAQIVLSREGISFPIDAQGANHQYTWIDSFWTAEIGGVSVEKPFTFSNPGFGSRVKATNVTYSVSPDDGQFVLDCITECRSTIEAGASFESKLKFKPVYIVPYVPVKNYKLFVNYYSGVRNRSYELDIQTRSSALPIISLRDTSENIIPETLTASMGRILHGKELIKQFRIYNHGPFDYTPSISLVDNGNTYFSLIDNTCHSSVIKNGNYCDFSIQFKKDEFVASSQVFNQDITFDNGLTGVDKKTFLYKLSATVLPFGIVTASTSAINFGDVPRSVIGRSENQSKILFTLTKPADTWDVTQIKFEISGADASAFTTNASDMSDSSFSTSQIEVNLNAPSTPSATDTTLTAKMKISYYGRWRTDFVSFLPGDEVEIDLVGVVKNAPRLEITQFTTNFGPIMEGQQQSGTVKVENIGQVTSEAKVRLVNGSVFQLTGMIADTGCQLVSSGTTIIFRISPGSECTFNTVFLSPPPGNHSDTVEVTYTSLNKEIKVIEPITGSGLNLAEFSISPTSTNNTSVHEYGELRIGQNVEKKFTLTHVKPNSTAGEIVSISLLPFGGTDCASPAKLPSSWKDLSIISGNNIDFTVTNTTCSLGQQLSYEQDCSIDIKFQPNHFNKVIGACLAIVYKPFPGAPAARHLTRIQPLAGLGLPPYSIFKGWHGILAEGETEHSSLKTTIQWKPMAVENNLGSVIGYHVFRKKLNESSYKPLPLNTSLITDMKSGEYFEFIDSQVEDIGEYKVPLEGEVYQYIVKPLISIPGHAETVLSETKELDRFLRVIMPFQNTVLIHRMMANIQTCMKMLDKSYTDLDRTKSYSCGYTGYGNNGSIFDASKDRIIDRYENTTVGNDPANIASDMVTLHSTLSEAKESCSLQKLTVSTLGINNKSKRLMSRQDYMIASIDQQKSGCIDNALELQGTGRNQCRSLFGVEDLIGNAWDYIDAELSWQNSNLTRWNYSTSLGIGSGREWLFDIPILNFEVAEFGKPLTFTQRNKYTALDTKCIHPIYGIPMKDIAGTCSSGSVNFSAIEGKLGVNSDLYYIFTLSNAKTLFEPYESKRYMMAGGSYNSRTRFGVDINRYSIYWSNPEIETFLYMSSPTLWEGGAARCILDLND